jgi:hypothetical protein
LTVLAAEPEPVVLCKRGIHCQGFNVVVIVIQQSISGSLEFTDHYRQNITVILIMMNSCVRVVGVRIVIFKIGIKVRPKYNRHASQLVFHLKVDSAYGVSAIAVPVAEIGGFTIAAHIEKACPSAIVVILRTKSQAGADDKQSEQRFTSSCN